MRHVAVVIDGVLRDPLNGQPDEHGRSLYQALSNNFRTTLLSDASDSEKDSDWLFLEGFTKHTKIVTTDAKKAPELRDMRLNQVRELRSIGPVDIVLNPDPSLVDDLYAMGQPQLLYINPKHLNQLPPRETWVDLEGRIDAARRRAATLHNED